MSADHGTNIEWIFVTCICICIVHASYKDHVQKMNEFLHSKAMALLCCAVLCNVWLQWSDLRIFAYYHWKLGTKCKQVFSQTIKHYQHWSNLCETNAAVIQINSRNICYNFKQNYFLQFQNVEIWKPVFCAFYGDASPLLCFGIRLSHANCRPKICHTNTHRMFILIPRIKVLDVA